MKKIYTSPVLLNSNEYSEGVYLASGASSASAQITKIPANSWDTYTVHFKKTADGQNPQTITIKFNQTINNAYGSFSSQITDSSTVTITIWSDQDIEGDLFVSSDSGLSVTSAF